MRDLDNPADWLRVTLSSIGDGVITTDRHGHVTMLNPVAQALTGWSQEDAFGKKLTEVFRIVNHDTRAEVDNPALRCLKDGAIVGLANHTLLISKDGTERPIDDSAAPIRNNNGEVAGVILVFRDITERYRNERLIKDAMDYASNILDTQREPFLVLSDDLRIISANRAFYRTFAVEKAQTEGRFVYDLGDGQWDIPSLRVLLEDVLPNNNVFEDFEVEHDFEGIGRKTMLLNARRVKKSGDGPELILLAIEDITERYRQQQLIKDAMDYASNILDTQREPFLVLSGDLRIISANRAFYRTFAVEKAQTEGCFVYDLGDGQWDIPSLRVLLEDVLPNNNVFEDFEVDHEFEGIGRKTMLLNARRISELGNNTELILLAIEDITERRAVELALRQKEDRYSTLFNSIDDGYTIIELMYDDSGKARDYRHIEVNPAFAKHSGIEQASGKSILELLPSIEPIWVEAYSRVVTSGEPVRMENQIKSLDDKWFNVYAVRIGGPETRRVAVVITNTTERKRIAETLKLSETRYRRLFESAKDGILILDAHTGKIIEANAFMSSLVGMKSDELIGKELYEIGMFADVEANKDAFRVLQNTGYLRHAHLPVRNKQGAKVEVEFVANVYQEGPNLVAQCNVRDISERVILENKITEQAEAMIDDSRRKDEFLAMLSHELRSPLAPIRSAVYLLKMHERESDNPVQQQAREIIERQVGNLTKLVSDLLEVSRVVSGRIRLDLETINLNLVVQRAVECVTPLMQQHKHTLKLHLCDEGTGGGVWVNADATRLEEVFINILTNAAKYTPDGGKIDVHCEQPKVATHARMRVVDNGVGIDSELLPRIFDLFTQAERSLDRSQGGLGIGLSLAHRLVVMHGGTLEAHSPPKDAKSGSEFIVSLKLVPPPQPKEPSQVLDQPEASIDGLRVLVVDDNIDLVLMLATTLRRKGFTVQTAYNGHDGLKAAQFWQADVVLLDIGLPGLNGYEVARQLRASPSMGNGGKRVKLIALTGYGREGDVSLAKEAGFDAHLIKPASFDELLGLMLAPTG